MSSKAVQLDLAAIKATLTVEALYLLGFSWLLGMSIWVSFFAGTIAFRTLPRAQFGTLQHRIFPAYFLSSIILSTGLLGIWVYWHPTVPAQWAHPYVADVGQAYSLLIVLLLQGSNHYLVGPWTSRTMFARHKQEKAEGKDHHDSTASAEMKSLNRRFAALHGLSSINNLIAIISLVFHGLWIGTHGIKP